MAWSAQYFKYLNRTCVSLQFQVVEITMKMSFRTVISRSGDGYVQKLDSPKVLTDKIAAMRKPYKGKHEVFDVDMLVSKEPFGQFNAWFEEAKDTDGIFEANAMSLATATKDGKPSVRPLLMKGMSKQGVVFYTNYLSRKSQELTENPQASVLFYWEPLKKCVRIEGRVERVSEQESTDYFHSRPRESQLGAVVSTRQSSVVESRKILDDAYEKLVKEYSDEGIQIPKPDYWGGWRLVPDVFEFWQGQSNRVHDRIVFRKQVPGEVIDTTLTSVGVDGWVYERLMP